MRLVITYLFLFFLATCAVVLNRFWQYEAFYFDHGIFDSSIYLVARGQTPLIDHLGKQLVSQVGDHFTPTMYLLSPIYFFTTKYEVVLILENLMVTGSAFVLYLVAKKRLKNNVLIWALIIAYTLFIGLQNAVIANFHTELLAVLTLSLTLWAIEEKRWGWYLFFLILTLGTKENFASIGLGLAIYLFLTKEKRLSLGTAIISVAYYFLATRVAIPFLGGQVYGYSADIYNPLEMIKNTFYPVVKTETIVVSVLTFGLLPLVGWEFWGAIGQDFFTRFALNPGSSRWDLGLHYNATLAVLLFYGAVVGAAKFNKFRWWSIYGVVMIGVILFLQRKYHGPLGLAFNPAFYRHTQDFQFLNKLLEHVPPKMTVMTNNNLAPYLTHTNTVWLLRSDYENFPQQAIVLDYRPGQNANNFWPLSPSGLKEFREKLATDSSYRREEVAPGQEIYFKTTSQP